MNTTPSRLYSTLNTNVEWMLRISFTIVFAWFGGLKIANLSPAHDLVVATLNWTGLVNIATILGVWEVIIGLCFLVPRLTKFTLLMFVVHMAGTFMPMVYLHDLSYFSFPLGLTIIGQYIIKNFVFLAAGAALYVRNEERY